MDLLPEYTLIRSHRRSLSIQITPSGEIVVRAPKRAPEGFIKKFILEKSSWINKHVTSMHIMHRSRTKHYIEGETFLYLGNEYKFHIGNFKTIHVSDALNFPDFLQFRAKKELTQWYISQAKAVITERVEYFANIMQADYKSIMFSDTKSKWGSCTPDNELQFSWRLIMSPLLVIDSVVVHELAHTWEKNHASRFWAIVKKYKPAYKQYRKWLNENSYRLVI